MPLPVPCKVLQGPTLRAGAAGLIYCTTYAYGDDSGVVMTCGAHDNCARQSRELAAARVAADTRQILPGNVPRESSDRSFLSSDNCTSFDPVGAVFSLAQARQDQEEKE